MKLFLGAILSALVVGGCSCDEVVSAQPDAAAVDPAAQDAAQASDSALAGPDAAMASPDAEPSGPDAAGEPDVGHAELDAGGPDAARPDAAAADVGSADSGGPTCAVTIAIEGDGAGHVTSTPPGIDCPASCAAAFPGAQTEVDVTATPAGGSRFVGWSSPQGECSGPEPVTAISLLSCPVTCTATFTMTAQPTSWWRFLGSAGAAFTNPVGYAIAATEDGGFIVAGDGYSGSTTLYDMFLVKLDAEGQSVWQKVYARPGYEHAHSVRITSDGGFIVAGYAKSETGLKQAWVVRLNGDGEALWSKGYGSTGESTFYDASPLPSGGYLAAGVFEGAYWIVRLDDAGAVVSQTAYGDPTLTAMVASDVYPDGSVVVAGIASSVTQILKVDGSGALAWQRNLGPDHWQVSALAHTADGGAVAVLQHVEQAPFQKVLVQLDATGALVLQRALVRSPNQHQTIAVRGVKQTAAGDFVLVANSDSPTYGAVIVARLSGEGQLEWESDFGGASGSMFDAARILSLADDGLALLGGASQGRAWVGHLGADGEISNTCYPLRTSATGIYLAPAATSVLNVTPVTATSVTSAASSADVDVSLAPASLAITTWCTN
ncbi:MAG: hypothetical protein HY901_06545 [Deltaproteobacteria bacterium]|nr:hypothetical protein [Deltaproteobacteria bacterium]